MAPSLFPSCFRVSVPVSRASLFSRAAPFTNLLYESMIVGKQPEEKLDVAVGGEVKTAPTAAEPWVTSLGVIDWGLELMRLAWPSLRHVFSVRRNDVQLPTPLETPTEPKVFQGVHRYPPVSITSTL
jgi:hypothetical protein